MFRALALIFSLLIVRHFTPLAAAQEARKASPLVFVDSTGPNRSVLQVDLGDIDPVSQPTVKRSFWLRNSSNAPVKIASLDASCGCTGLMLNGQVVDSTGVQLEAGAQAEIQSTTEVFLIHPGQMTKYVWVHLESEKEAAATVEIKLNLRPCVKFFPNLVAFPRSPAGSSRSMKIVAEVDERIAKAAGAKGLPALVSSDPDLTVAADANLDENPAGGERQQSKTIRKSYTIRLSSKAALGVHFASVSYPPSTGGGETVDPKWMVLAQAQLSVQAVVDGRISITPSFVFAGTLPPGRAHIEKVKLVAKNRAALTGLSVTSGSPWLTAKVVPDKSQPLKATVEVQISASAPKGFSQVQVLFRTSDGQKLVLPVSVNIDPKLDK